MNLHVLYVLKLKISELVYYDTSVRGTRLTQVRKSRSHVYRILFFKTSAASFDDIRVAYIIFLSECREARRNTGIKFLFQVKMHNMNRNILSKKKGFLLHNKYVF